MRPSALLQEPRTHIDGVFIKKDFILKASIKEVFIIGAQSVAPPAAIMLPLRCPGTFGLVLPDKRPLSK
jgi:hypothetical protein